MASHHSRFTAGKEPQNALNRRLGGLQSRPGRFGGEHILTLKNIQSAVKNNSTFGTILQKSQNCFQMRGFGRPGVRRDVDEICTVWVVTQRVVLNSDGVSDNLSAPSSAAKNP